MGRDMSFRVSVPRQVARARFARDVIAAVVVLGLLMCGALVLAGYVAARVAGVVP